MNVAPVISTGLDVPYETVIFTTAPAVGQTLFIQQNEVREEIAELITAEPEPEIAVPASKHFFPDDPVEHLSERWDVPLNGKPAKRYGVSGYLDEMPPQNDDEVFMRVV